MSKPIKTASPNPRSAGTSISLLDEERDMILAALRLWQRATDDDLMEIATNSGSHKPLTADQIDRLCEDLNK